MTTLELLSALGGVSGIVGLLGAAVGYGKLQQRLASVENEITSVKDLSGQVARIDERTKNTERNVLDVKENLADLTRVLIEDAGRVARRRVQRG